MKKEWLLLSAGALLSLFLANCSTSGSAMNSSNTNQAEIEPGQQRADSSAQIQVSGQAPSQSFTNPPEKVQKKK